MKPYGSITKGLFTWREGAPANRATRLEGLKQCQPFHATHLTKTVSGLRELSILFQLPAHAQACSLAETSLLH